MQFLRIIDSRLFNLIHSISGLSVFFDKVIIFFAEYLPYILIFVFIILLYRLRLSLKEKFLLLCTTFISPAVSVAIVSAVIRYFYNRPRPFLQNHFTPLFNETSFSLPSNHAIFFFSLAFSIYFFNKKWGIWFIIFASVISFARVAAGVHFPSDIIAGALLGYCVSLFTYKMISPLFRKFIGSDKSNQAL